MKVQHRPIPPDLEDAMLADPARLEQAWLTFAEGKHDRSAARARARALCPELDSKALWYLERWAIGEYDPTDGPAVARGSTETSSAEADAPEPPAGLASDEERQRVARDELDRRLRVGDVDGARKAADLAKAIANIPRGAEAQGELDYSRLNHDELQVLMYLCDLCRGLRRHDVDAEAAGLMHRLSDAVHK